MRFTYDAFYEGEKYLKNEQFEKARECFKIAYTDLKLRNRAIERLANIYFKEHDYQSARDLLEESNVDDNAFLQMPYCKLEFLEYNCSDSFERYNNCLVLSNHYNHLNDLKAKLYIFEGNYNEGYKLLKNLAKNGDIIAKLKIVNLFIRIGDNKEAYKYLLEIDKKQLSGEHLWNYVSSMYYLKFCLGKLKSEELNNIANQNHYFYTLFYHDEDATLRHIEKHKMPYEKCDSVFFEDLDINKLLKDCKEKIENMNPHFFSLSDVYKVHLDSPIGNFKDKVTNDVCVYTLKDEKEIVTIHPMLLSTRYDREKLSTSEEFRLKRINGKKSFKY